jgi:hypothetical protein
VGGRGEACVLKYQPIMNVILKVNGLFFFYSGKKKTKTKKERK